MTQPILQEQFACNISDSWVQLDDSETKQKAFDHYLCLFVACANQQLHLRDRADRQPLFGFCLLQILNCLADFASCVDQNIGVNDQHGASSHSLWRSLRT